MGRLCCSIVVYYCGAIIISSAVIAAACPTHQACQAADANERGRVIGIAIKERLKARHAQPHNKHVYSGYVVTQPHNKHVYSGCVVVEMLYLPYINFCAVCARNVNQLQRHKTLVRRHSCMPRVNQRQRGYRIVAHTLGVAQASRPAVMEAMETSPSWSGLR